MSQDLAAQFEAAVARESAELMRLPASGASTKPTPSAWSQKEELGHLIDSAANNQQRFVRAAIDGEFRGPGYQQDEWVVRHGYNDLDWIVLVDLWSRYNLLLAGVVRRIPAERMPAPCFIGAQPPETLQFVIEDYLVHMQHHLDHILRRESVTPYPRKR